jgi:hypothetical protein
MVKEAGQYLNKNYWSQHVGFERYESNWEIPPIEERTGRQIMINILFFE